MKPVRYHVNGWIWYQLNTEPLINSGSLQFIWSAAQWSSGCKKHTVKLLQCKAAHSEAFLEIVSCTRGLNHVATVSQTFINYAFNQFQSVLTFSSRQEVPYICMISPSIVTLTIPLKCPQVFALKTFPTPGHLTANLFPALRAWTLRICGKIGLKQFFDPRVARKMVSVGIEREIISTSFSLLKIWQTLPVSKWFISTAKPSSAISSLLSITNGNLAGFCSILKQQISH